MTTEHADSSSVSVRHLLRRGWDTLLTVYYANTIPWRLLKAGSLFFFGFFLWAGSNIVRSYFQSVWLLRYTLSYGFVLIVYGPFHHLVVIPVYQRLRKRGTHLSLGGHFHLPNASLAVFLTLVVVLGTFPVGPMTIDFTSSLQGGGDDVSHDLTCVKSTANGTTTIHCHLTESSGIDRVVVTSGGEQIAVAEEPPFRFTIRAGDLQTVTGSKRFRVDLLAEDGTLVRRFTRSSAMIEED